MSSLTHWANCCTRIEADGSASCDGFQIAAGVNDRWLHSFVHESQSTPWYQNNTTGTRANSSDLGRVSQNYLIKLKRSMNISRKYWQMVIPINILVRCKHYSICFSFGNLYDRLEAVLNIFRGQFVSVISRLNSWFLAHMFFSRNGPCPAFYNASY